MRFLVSTSEVLANSHQVSMTTLNYTSTAGDPALDAAFEQALATARAGPRGAACRT